MTRIEKSCPGLLQRLLLKGPNNRPADPICRCGYAEKKKDGSGRIHGRNVLGKLSGFYAAAPGDPRYTDVTLVVAAVIVVMTAVIGGNNHREISFPEVALCNGENPLNRRVRTLHGCNILIAHETGLVAGGVRFGNMNEYKV